MMFLLFCVMLTIFVLIYLWGKQIKESWIFPFVTSFFLFISGTGIYLTIKGGQGDDKMILNGYVTEKLSEEVSCGHSYSCNCITQNVNGVVMTTCSTCYEHSYDVDWKVKSTVGSIEIDRVDRQGTEEPPRFTEVKLGEPFSIQKSYYNYIKASPLSIFKDYNAYKDVAVPAYPKIYDYYRVDHVVNWNSQWVEGKDNINYLLTEKLKVSSSKAKANVILILYGGSDDQVEAMRVKNLGGRINDLIVMVRPDKDGNIMNVGVFSWSKNDMVNVAIRDEILDLRDLNGENQKKLVDILDKHLLQYYQHRSIEEFKYLEANTSMPVWYYVLVVILCLLAIGVNFYIFKEVSK